MNRETKERPWFSFPKFLDIFLEIFLPYKSRLRSQAIFHYLLSQFRCLRARDCVAARKKATVDLDVPITKGEIVARKIREKESIPQSAALDTPHLTAMRPACGFPGNAIDVAARVRVNDARGTQPDASSSSAGVWQERGGSFRRAMTCQTLSDRYPDSGERDRTACGICSVPYRIVQKIACGSNVRVRV